MISLPFATTTRAFLAICLSLTATGFATSPVIDDQEIIESLSTQLGDMVGKDGVPSAEDLAKTTEKGSLLKPNVTISSPAAAPGKDYETLSRSVYLIATVYKCGKCNKWH